MSDYLKKLEENNAAFYKHLADLETLNSELKEKIYKLENPWGITSTDITAKTRKLKTRWSIDIAQDFSNINLSDIEQDVINEMEKEVTKLSWAGYTFDTKAHPNLIIPVKG